MRESTSILTKNISDHITSDPGPLVTWVERYLSEAVAGRMSPNTLRSKIVDLRSFCEWYRDNVGHLDIADWMPRDTVAYLTHIEQQGAAPATVNHRLATLGAFAKWLLARQDGPLMFGNPTSGAQWRHVEEGAPRALTSQEYNAMLRAAERLTVTETRKNAQPRRNRAILSVLINTGLRVSELAGLRADQYQGKHLVNVVRKGRARSPKVFLPEPCRAILDDYIATERPAGAAWLFTASSPAKPVTPRTVANVLNHVAEEASKHRAEPIRVHPHALRHTFGTRHLEAGGSESETAKALGHSSTRYVGIYTRRTDAQREELLESMAVS